MIGAIFATDDDGAFGYKGKIPWHIPNDFKHFKKVTVGANIVMGRKTWESLPGILPMRKHIVLSSTLTQTDNMVVYPTVEDIIEQEGTNLWVIGGEGVFFAFRDEIGFDIVYHSVIPGEHKYDTSLDYKGVLRELKLVKQLEYSSFRIDKYVNPSKF